MKEWPVCLQSTGHSFIFHFIHSFISFILSLFLLFFAKKTQNIWSFRRKALYLHLVIIDFIANEFS